MTDVHIERNIVIADYAVGPGTLIHRVLKDKILIVEGQSEPLVSTALLCPSLHLSTVCDLSFGSRSVAILSCHFSVYCANYSTACNRFRITGVAFAAFFVCSDQAVCATQLPVGNRR